MNEDRRRDARSFRNGPRALANCIKLYRARASSSYIPSFTWLSTDNVNTNSKLPGTLTVRDLNAPFRYTAWIDSSSPTKHGGSCALEPWGHNTVQVLQGGNAKFWSTLGKLVLGWKYGKPTMVVCTERSARSRAFIFSRN